LGADPKTSPGAADLQTAVGAAKVVIDDPLGRGEIGGVNAADAKQKRGKGKKQTQGPFLTQEKSRANTLRDPQQT
jgi:hypothetical protein